MKQEIPIKLIHDTMHAIKFYQNEVKSVLENKHKMFVSYVKGVSERIGKIKKVYGSIITYQRIRNDLYHQFYNNKDPIEK